MTTAFLFLSFCEAWFNQVWHAELSSPLAVVGDVIILSLSTFLLWLLVRKRTWYIAVFGVGIHLLLLEVLTLLNSRNATSTLGTTRSDLERLGSLDYVGCVEGDEEIELSRVTRNEHYSSVDALDVYNHDLDPVAYLIDMEGEVVHKWSDGFSQWHHVELLPDGDLLGVVQNRGLFRLNWQSEVEWVVSMLFHHDVDADDNGDIYGIARQDMLTSHGSLPIYILNDHHIILDSKGEIRKRIPLYEVVEDLIPPINSSRAWEM